VDGEYVCPPSGMATFFASHHMPCDECGASVHVADADEHECEPTRLLEYRLFLLRDEVAGFDERLSDYLGSPQGRFAQWLAERERKRRR
jgi:hypothetical protein